MVHLSPLVCVQVGSGVPPQTDDHTLVAGPAWARAVPCPRRPSPKILSQAVCATRRRHTRHAQTPRRSCCRQGQVFQCIAPNQPGPGRCFHLVFCVSSRGSMNAPRFEAPGRQATRKGTQFLLCRRQRLSKEVQGLLENCSCQHVWHRTLCDSPSLRWQRARLLRGACWRQSAGQVACRVVIGYCCLAAKSASSGTTAGGAHASCARPSAHPPVSVPALRAHSGPVSSR
jgi:hypothetical protein